MARVANYSILFYGGAEGFQKNRAQIQLSDESGNTIALLRFYDPNAVIESDFVDGDIIRMHLPACMLQTVIDVLRNEKPINVYYIKGRGFLGTTNEPVGESECMS
ncbi:hypothetical protein SPSYN_01878 [Sporotomaculum syntrophicum]|uniref:Uncharacterized protein n=1 Tax=Sporotomaculum syntrophicum TaxID=182264 RepID=A0A9D2WSD6_9FIRM|nr:hypothetical protein [Sporotomaculum syntrophicum]KAF1085732.1 hypothetical protein SPSYN_01878 [Sporotomaculum syntrophicum]